MSRGENGGSNQGHQEIDQQNPKEINGSQSDIVDMTPGRLSSKIKSQNKKEDRIKIYPPSQAKNSNIRNPPIEIEKMPLNPDSIIPKKEREAQTSFEIGTEGPFINVGKTPIEDQNKEVMENELEKSNLKKTDKIKEEEVGDHSSQTTSTSSKKGIIWVITALYGWIELLFLELEPGSITPNYSKKFEIKGDRQDIDDIINQILEIFKIIDDYQNSPPNSSLPKDRETLKVWQKAYFELKDQETEERNYYSLLLREIILGVTQNDFKPISRKDIKQDDIGKEGKINK